VLFHRHLLVGHFQTHPFLFGLLDQSVMSNVRRYFGSKIKGLVKDLVWAQIEIRRETAFSLLNRASLLKLM
jgi:hypothetical protein